MHGLLYSSGSSKERRLSEPEATPGQEVVKKFDDDTDRYNDAITGARPEENVIDTTAAEEYYHVIVHDKGVQTKEYTPTASEHDQHDALALERACMAFEDFLASTMSKDKELGDKMTFARRQHENLRQDLRCLHATSDKAKKENTLLRGLVEKLRSLNKSTRSAAVVWLLL
eukprot:TRINITY_DN30059_c0_g1_i10.p1 TRINITY_DN30059_c0_g1~~TRINITY_DN30059_c0_g1_i10.p1  ORF type:complete len:171 (-),score=39.15 TRINITY_DN30059_c0_g1_i10:156-668(-)